MAKLTAKQQRFVEEYMIDLNATKAAIRAGYSKKTAKDIACETLAKPYIQAYLEKARRKVSEKAMMTVERILLEFGRIALLDARKFFDEDGELIPIHLLDEDTARCVGGIEHYSKIESVGSDGETVTGKTTKIKIINKKGALDSVAKHLGMFIERHEHGRPGEFANYSDEDLDKYIKGTERSLGYGQKGTPKKDGENRPDSVH